MKKLQVEHVIICKQYKTSENYETFKRITKEKKIDVSVINKGMKLRIENEIYFTFLWPHNDEMISVNALNNNSIVCKLDYRDFSVLYTGDIEEIAERKIVNEYKKDIKALKSTILKVAHHGSKTSSTQEFINAVSPKVALIGVGKNNKFGHPNENVIIRLNKLRYNCI